MVQSTVQLANGMIRSWRIRVGRIGIAVLALWMSGNRCLEADTIALSAVDSGWYTDPGYHDGSIKNYLAGISQGSLPPPQAEYDHHDYFVFDLSRIRGTVNSARLEIFAGICVVPASGLHYSLFDVSTIIPDLEASQGGRTDIFFDLGSGTSYGSRVMGSGDSGTVIAVDMNPAALTALTADEGRLFAVGGALDATGDDQFVFGSTSEMTVRLLVLDVTPIPEPSALLLLAIGSIALIGNAYGLSRSFTSRSNGFAL